MTVLDLPTRKAVSGAITEELERLDTDALKSELASVLTLTAHNLCRAAAIVKIIESRGEDLSALRIGLMGYLRKIACGQVLPEVVARFMGSPALKAIAALPIPDQQTCLSSDGLPVGALVNGEVETRHKPLLQMEPFEVRQVFAADRIRTPQEQIAWLRSREMQKPQLEAVIEPPPYTISGNAIVVHRPVKLSKRDIKAMLRSLGEEST